MPRLRIYFIIVLFTLVCSCKQNNEIYKLSQVTNSGVLFTNEIKSTPELNILNYLYFYNGAGTAIADFNNDGLLDIYFTGNQVADKLYLNTGNLTFKDISTEAGINLENTWNTGVTTVDINHDGLLDIYVSTVSGHLNLKGHNKLFINQGSQEGIPTFLEKSAEYGLDYSGLSTQASFFDYDLDGDLDLYLLNHSVHPNSSYGRAALRNTQDSINGDRFYINNKGSYLNYTEQAGILSSKIGYGLGVSVSDLNNDGYPDLYIANDFFENDYLYMNQKDGTFKELNTTTKILGHTSHFSMGSDMADINNDGLSDILSLDMLPEKLEVLKASSTEYAYPIYQNQLRNGYDYEFMQNALQLNLGNNRFSEIAFQSGIAATEWSWSPLIADFDNDGYKDIYIANGILGATNDMDFVNFISNEAIQRRLGKNMTEREMEFIKKIPKTHVTNYAYKNTGGSSFKDVTKQWTSSKPSFSNGASYADLDNDGDLDIVVNNINEAAYILENNTAQSKENQKGISIRFKGSKENTFGIGAKITTFVNGTMQVFENYTTRGFMSAVPPSVFVGLGNSKSIDSLQIIWPSGKVQKLKNIQIKETILLKEEDAIIKPTSTAPFQSEIQLVNVASKIDFVHKDGSSIEFSRDALVPYANTNTGPQLKAADLNSDGFEDLIILGAKGQETQLYFQNKKGDFVNKQLPEAAKDAINEDTAVALFDVNNDGLTDILIASGGNEFTTGKPLTPRLYLNSANGYILSENEFDGLYINASKISPVDFDNDGDLDFAITSDLVPHEFGATPSSYLFMNDGKGHFKNATDSLASEFSNIGNVKDLIWADIDGNGYNDALVCGHWMPIQIFLNDGKKLSLQKNSSLDKTNGLWNALIAEDFDNDGDLDFIAGNWGLNTRLTASLEKPLSLYRYDFDANGKIDPVTTYFYKDTETILATKDEIVKQIPPLNKKFLSYHAFAQAHIEDLFSKEKLKKADKKKVFTLETTYFENTGNSTFKVHKLPFMTQISSTKAIFTDDFNSDGFKDILLLGNDSEISTQLGRQDASHGIFLLNNGQGSFNYTTQHNVDIKGASRSITPIKIKDSLFYIIGRNNESPLFLRKEN
ncbi:VCBS repeat-containing protein [Leeuwenhoekiella sp. W20_SRS_FM14]|uniref:VCBS repeat-containing protein n=1 Tax=Leeuwenhoekiella sp. W20_SRS_FM14 TaxID=3240270 RepID=UPI003F955C0F